MEKLRQISMLTAVAFALALGFALLPAPRAQAGIVSLTAATLCQSPNGNGGDWCQANGTPFYHNLVYDAEPFDDNLVRVLRDRQ